MNFRYFSLFLVAVFLFGISKSTLAAGPLDAEVGVVWWFHEVDSSDLDTIEADGSGSYADIWWANSWGLSANYFESEPDFAGLADTSSFSLDIKRRVLSPTENNYIALGAGWEDNQLVGGGTAEGPRLLVEARAGVGILFAYGQLAWMPDLGDSGILRNIEGTETDIGISLTPFPLLNLRLGYRRFETDFLGGSHQADGFYAGAALHF
ncbi:MAG: hypothetical protein ACI8P9_002331 [Parasphingorhabdus sp.]|jgi:hypothetical protein